MDGQSYRSGTSGITKFYVSRLQERCSSEDISVALGAFGTVEGVYIARKRDKRGYRFGFASFKWVKDAVELEKEMRNIWMGNYRPIINVARFVMENEMGRGNKVHMGKKMGQFDMEQGGYQHTFNKQEGNIGNFFSNSRSYAEIVAGKVNGSTSMKEVVVFGYVKAYGDLHGKAIVGKVKDLWTLRKIYILLKEANYGDALIKYIGGLNILLVFKSSSEADRCRADSSGFGWFDIVEIWRGQSVAFE
ncbi:putative RNA recognition motif domain, nucleotide-binding alpha-beta plait domain superfamily [Helianthus annuus]|nr:putative RNA recognition motif domain, nucleotide-binding alpha-beta plait domain superfamily [Helianthus annuus]KAJ0675666.1 putative RNA recognition motif domain, nucleotide-binding alpha-beta plait domain superfamily [Helianthus annuus]